MSKTWYPVIDYEKCMECCACINKCKHGVYDSQKSPTPVVVMPEHCIHGCHGCGNLCLAKAIHYVGDTGRGIGIDGRSCGDQQGGCC